MNTQIRVEDLIVKELQKSSDHLHILMETGLTSALEGFVLKNESHAIEGSLCFPCCRPMFAIPSVRFHSVLSHAQIS
jgi:hypothetical protein